VLPLRLRCLVAVALLGCGSGQRPLDARAIAQGGPSSRIEQRSLTDRPALAIVEREGDPLCAIGFASLAAGSPELHAALGEILRQRLLRVGVEVELVVHGLGFELTLLGHNSRQSGAVVQALLQALAQPVSSSELSSAAQAATRDAAPPSAVDACSAELPARRPFSDAAELERERVATFAADRAALSVVGSAEAAAGVAEALGAGPDWPELGAVPSRLPSQSETVVVRGERPTLSVALTVPEVNRALGAAESLGQPRGALDLRLAALGGGFGLRRVVATAHPQGACLRIDSDLDASPLPDAKRIGYAVHFMAEEAGRAIAAAPAHSGLEGMAVSAADPRASARAAAFRALILGGSPPSARLVALLTPDEAPHAPAIQAAAEQARTAPSTLEVTARVERGQPGTWALVSFGCAAADEDALRAGRAALFVAAAASTQRAQVRIEPWIGGGGVGLMGFTERAPGETEAAAAERLGDELGRALVAPPSAVEVAAARAELLKLDGDTPRPLLERVLELLAPGASGSLSPRGNGTSLQAASREAVLSRQRELLRQLPRLAVITPGSTADAAPVGRSLARWLQTPDALRPSPCAAEVSWPSRAELSLMGDAAETEGSYLAFRVPGRSGAEAGVLAELLNLPAGALARAMAEPDLVGAARALTFGTNSARALVVQVSAFEGREIEAVSRVQKLFERLATGGALSTPDLEAALARRRSRQQSAELDARHRLAQLQDPAPHVPDAAALRRFMALLRPSSAIVARSGTAKAPAGPEKSTPSR
jgi:hypothetical protein